MANNMWLVFMQLKRDLFAIAKFLLPPPTKFRRYCDVIPGVCLLVCLSVCLFVSYQDISKTLFADFNQILWNDRFSAMDQSIIFWD